MDWLQLNLPAEVARCTDCRSGIIWRMFYERERKTSATASAGLRFRLDEEATLASTATKTEHALNHRTEITRCS